jgi:hypothetical protein
VSRNPHGDALEEARELLAAASERGLQVRALGGVAVRLACPSASRPPLERGYKDIDLVGLRRERDQIDALLVEFGYQPDVEFNLLNGDSRLYYWDTANERQLDVFLNRMEMCHVLELEERLPLGEEAVSPTDLLLSKLQVVETNEDAAAVLLDCEVDDDYVAALLASDWGWWRTATMVLERLDEYASSLEFDGRDRLRARIDTLRVRIDAEPKSRRWKLRARMGERKRWYQLPEEDHVTG